MNKKVYVKCQFIPGTIMSPTMKSGIRFIIQFPEWIHISNIEDMRFDVSEKTANETIGVRSESVYFVNEKKYDELKVKYEKLWKENQFLQQYVPIKKRWEDEIKENIHLREQLEFYKSLDILEE